MEVEWLLPLMDHEWDKEFRNWTRRSVPHWQMAWNSLKKLLRWHKNWQPVGQHHIPSNAHKAFHARKLRQFSGSGKYFDHLKPWWILNPVCFEELPFRHLFAVFLLSSEALCSTFFLLILAWTYRFDYRFLVELSDWVFNLLCSWARLLCWVVM